MSRCKPIVLADPEIVNDAEAAVRAYAAFKFYVIRKTSARTDETVTMPPAVSPKG